MSKHQMPFEPMEIVNMRQRWTTLHDQCERDKTEKETQRQREHGDNVSERHRHFQRRYRINLCDSFCRMRTIRQTKHILTIFLAWNRHQFISSGTKLVQDTPRHSLCMHGASYSKNGDWDHGVQRADWTSVCVCAREV